MTGFAAVYAGVALWRSTSVLYRTCALTLSGLAAFEVLSGVLLAAASSTVSAASLCANIALYMSLVAVVEALLFIKMKKLSMSFPLTEALAPILGSLALMGVTIAYGI